jgi:hypothetical protein
MDNVAGGDGETASRLLEDGQSKQRACSDVTIKSNFTSSCSAVAANRSLLILEMMASL